MLSITIQRRLITKNTKNKLGIMYITMKTKINTSIHLLPANN